MSDVGGPFLAIIPARGGSKGVPRKNVRDLAGRPLLQYTIDAARGSRYALELVVSTDDEEIASIARRAGAEVPFVRPPALAKDDTPTLAVLQHVLRTLAETRGPGAAAVVLLQPTSPLRTSRHVDEAVALFLDSGADSVVSLCRAEHPPHWMHRVEVGGRVVPFLPDAAIPTRRQESPEVYRLNGAIYITRPAMILEEGRLLGGDVRAYIMSVEDSIDIDTELDFNVAALLLEGRRKRGSRT